MTKIPWNLLHRDEPFTDRAGLMTRSWRRVMTAIWEDLGRGQATESLVDVAADKFLARAPAGPDTGRAIADLAIGQAAAPSVAGRVADLEIAVAQLGMLVRRRHPADAARDASLDTLALQYARPADSGRVRDELLKGAAPPQAGRIAGLERRVADVEVLAMYLPAAAAGTSEAAKASATVWAPLTNGDLPGPTLIANGAGECIMVPVT